MPDRLYGEHYPDSFLDMPRPIRTTDVRSLGDYIRYLQEVDKQSDQSCVACEPIKSGFEHLCPNNPILTCNCANPNTCAELGSDPDGNFVDGNKICPKSGKICNDRVCPNECLDELEYAGNPYPKRKSAVSGWPCVVVGALPETGFTTGECVSECEHSAGDTERHTDAR